MTTLKIEETIRETDKAILVQTEVDTMVGLKGRKVWLPKSQITKTAVDHIVEIPAWLAAAKLKDMDDFQGRAGLHYCFVA